MGAGLWGAMLGESDRFEGGGERGPEAVRRDCEVAIFFAGMGRSSSLTAFSLSAIAGVTGGKSKGGAWVGWMVG